jgi:hypothetical protein
MGIYYIYYQVQKGFKEISLRLGGAAWMVDLNIDIVN